MAAWRADHDGGCPATLADLVAGGYLHSVPRDAWDHPLRVTCPGRRDPKGFDVVERRPGRRDGRHWMEWSDEDRDGKDRAGEHRIKEKRDAIDSEKEGPAAPADREA